MEPTFPINYRAGWIEPVDEYIPEIMEPKPEWTTTNRLPDYGPVVDDDPQPTQSSPILPKHTKKCNTWNPSIKNTLPLSSSMNPICWICQ